MMFRDIVSEHTGCFQIKGLKVVGNYPSCLIDTKFYEHWSSSPIGKNTRDVIEITLSSRIEDDFEVTYGGWQSGYPLNPFKNWKGKRI